MTTKTPLTADTITTAQIRALKTEAATAGDDAMVATCRLALGLVEGANRGAEEDARQSCADAINDATARE